MAKTGARGAPRSGGHRRRRMALCFCARRKIPRAPPRRHRRRRRYSPAYQFNKYRSNAQAGGGDQVFDTSSSSGLKQTAALQKAVDTAQAMIPAVFLARDLVNEPPSVATARFLGDQAQRALPRPRAERRSLGQEKDRVDEAWPGCLAVNRGSQEEPRFIKIHYRPARQSAKRKSR